jgi:hypothetical protein
MDIQTDMNTNYACKRLVIACDRYRTGGEGDE